MKTINLYFDFEFTSLSPDAQPISLGIVSDEDGPDNWLIHPKEFKRLKLNKDDYELVERSGGTGYVKKVIFESKSFYAEFSDFDINRCDDWVKENVVGKLNILEFPLELGFKKDAALKMLNNGMGVVADDVYKMTVTGPTSVIKENLIKWLEQFSDYQIQFVADCGTYDWYWMVQLLAEWQITSTSTDGCPICGYDALFECNNHNIKTGLPKLPDNISPVPFDLNDLIAIKKGMTPEEAFYIERLGSFCQDNKELYDNVPQSHNALFDAKVIKETYNKLR